MRVRVATDAHPVWGGALGVAAEDGAADGSFKALRRPAAALGSCVVVAAASLEPAASRPIPRRVPDAKESSWKNAGPQERGGGDVFAEAAKDAWRGYWKPERRDIDLQGYVAMEKYDGIRAMWEPDIGGECGFRTKGGVRTWKCSNAEMRDALLGWDECGAFMRGHWESIAFKVFDAPSAAGGLLERLDAARRALAGFPTARVVSAVPCEDAAAVGRLLTRAEALGGEGLILRDSRLGLPAHCCLRAFCFTARVSLFRPSFRPGRQEGLLKVKRFYSGVCKVIGQARGQMPEAWLPTGTTLTTSTILTYEYPGLNNCGMPRFAGKIKRVHEAGCACEACALDRRGGWPAWDGLASKTPIEWYAAETGGYVFTG
ncbi:hypothetical protein EMIHUDRAFT_195959 [Emiliania huxleyi CCMP1516]|uniref:ATP-dependent DNA ligase family profile domain-containing protein n=2 Tax=Emiliania huxleyi TaxID=2903 RepID=A0A0D3J378_EMIH1|nr:hypothetical protein EMIHUDRAFT_195959 [Emiliania huxleyi CCMP1516]EOD17963.1 hypothetical protein EMIHUDRAFT_195959 [Emiliania huxleyi CCMP1516]|eukprot:XP_005770392.1 hypothetical protein EMIHUDRAFT_195959 [Emiliania huxleyi CCMP1516]